jgi:hypothetical protein
MPDAGKKWFTSKTLWVNIIAVVADILLRFFNINLPNGADIAALGAINLILRLITKEAIVW